MQVKALFHFNYQRIGLMISDAALIALAVFLSYVVAFVGENEWIIPVEGFYTVLLYWLGTLLVFAYGKLYAKPSTAFTRKDLKWLAMMNVYVVGAVFLTEYLLNPEYWLFALLFMLTSFVVRTITTAICAMREINSDLTMIAVIPFAIGAVAALVLTPIAKPYVPLPDKTLGVSAMATILYFIYSTVLLALGRYFQAWLVKKNRVIF
ncbi:MAG: hypothetical protein M0P13_08960 [Fibrobacteraceae bacterium]|nr:hypothetical protein [Fibrobacteraceae bacterium]